MPKKKQAAAYFVFLTIVLTVLMTIYRAAIGFLFSSGEPIGIKALCFEMAGIWVLLFLYTYLIGAALAEQIASALKKQKSLQTLSVGIAYTIALVPVYTLIRLILTVYLTGKAEGIVLILTGIRYICMDLSFGAIAMIAVVLPIAGMMLNGFVKGYTKIKKDKK